MSKFWDEVIYLRRYGKIPKLWSAEDLYTHLDGVFARGTIKTLPLNQSVSRDGAVKGYYVKRGRPAMVYRLPGSYFELINDPEA